MPNIYHEKQRKELCALHALNNIFQDSQSYSKQLLDDICQNLAPTSVVNPHKSVLGLGNYDVNVIMAALQHKNCEAVWWDKRRNMDFLNLNHIVGFILNIPSPIQLGPLSFLPLKRKHWIALREIDGIYYNLDSKLKNPEVLGDASALKKYLRSQAQIKDCEVLLVVTKDTADLKSWKIDKQEANALL